MLGTGQQHWSTVHVADLADFFRRVLEEDSARGRYVIGNRVNPTVAELTEAAAVAVGAPGAVPDPMMRPGRASATISPKSCCSTSAPPRPGPGPNSAGIHPIHHLPASSATGVTANDRNGWALWLSAGVRARADR